MFQKNSQATLMEFIYTCIRCTSLLKHFHIQIRSSNSTASSHAMEYSNILTLFTDDHLDMKTNKFLCSELHYYYSIPVSEFLTETDSRISTDLHKTRIWSLWWKTLLLNRSWVWETLLHIKGKLRLWAVYYMVNFLHKRTLAKHLCKIHNRGANIKTVIYQRTKNL